MINTADKSAYELGHAMTCLTKAGGDAVRVHALCGRLYASKSGWVLLSVPNAMVRGAFDALGEPGVQLPLDSAGNLNAHISVMSADEVESLGGVDAITERGHEFNYTLGPIKEVIPGGWKDYSKVWYITVYSPELQKLRRSYGLPSLPHDNAYDFHITIAVRRTGVLHENPVSKALAERQLKAAALLLAGG